MHRVLLVNDCNLENFIMRDMLLDLGHEVIISNEYTALSDARELSCDVVIANFIMREKTGDKILQQIKNINPKAKCILSSSNAIKLEDFNKSVVDAVIRTPLTIERLEGVLKENDHIEEVVKENIHSGKEQLQPSFCTSCGKKFDVSDGLVKFCKYCGQRCII